MAKSLRCKVKKQARSRKRETGEYHIKDAERVARLNARLLENNAKKEVIGTDEVELATTTASTEEGEGVSEEGAEDEDGEFAWLSLKSGLGLCFSVLAGVWSHRFGWREALLVGPLHPGFPPSPRPIIYLSHPPTPACLLTPIHTYPCFTLSFDWLGYRGSRLVPLLHIPPLLQ